MRHLLVFLLALLAACNQDVNEADAYGSFEADEVTVSAEISGKVVKLNLEEGDTITAGQVVGLLDTSAMHLEKRQLLARMEVLRAKFPNLSAELEVLDEQLKNLEDERERFSQLAKSGAVPAKQVDDLDDQISVLSKRKKVVQSGNQPVARELDLILVQIEQVDDRIQRAKLAAPINGTVVLKLVEQGEFVPAGRPVFRLADLSSMTMRAYISGSQLDDIQIGDEVNVLTDADEDTFHEHKGIVTWISSEAEFTPRSIQTKQERADLVYAVKVVVKNDGTIKIGMPGEVKFKKGNTNQDDQGK